MATRSKSKQRSFTFRRPLMPESLEKRDLFAADVYLDFNGASRAEMDAVFAATPDDESTLGLSFSGFSSISSFVGGFNSLSSSSPRFQFLDFSGDGMVNAVDGEMAASQIINRVQEDFSPYNVTIRRQDNSFASANALRANPTNDTVVFIDGHSVNMGGQALLDINNRKDGAAGVGGSVAVANAVANNSTITDKRNYFINQFANFISHEVGHSFGLEHTTSTGVPDLMVPFLGGNNLGFSNVGFARSSGTVQNDHQYLTQTVGASNSAWAAVLNQGQLTLSGGNGDDAIYGYASGTNWVIYGNIPGSATTVDPSAAPNLNSLNQFTSPITTIFFDGKDGNDRLGIDGSINVQVIAYGGRGDDLLQGGSGSDSLYGNEGNDTLYGNSGYDVLFGGANDDRLYGGNDSDWLLGEDGFDTIYGGEGGDWIDGGNDSDWLIGENGNDSLFGGQGYDWLDGGFGDDFLDGGFDGIADYIFGGDGNDTFVMHYRTNLLGNPVFEYETMVDLLANDRISYRT